MGRSFDGTLFLNILFVEDYFNEKADSQISFLELLDKLDEELLKKMLSKKDVISFVLTNGIYSSRPTFLTTFQRHLCRAGDIK